MIIRPLAGADFDSVIAMNNAAMPAVGELNPAHLAHLCGQACWSHVAEIDGEVAGFLVGFDGPGRDYDSLNYQAFSAKYPHGFIYVDRVVVSPDHRSAGIGAQLYDAFAEFGRSIDHTVLLAEVNVRPRNDGSLRFHRRYGFRPDGEQDTDGGDKRVQFLAFDLTGEAPVLDRDSITDEAADMDPELANRLEFLLDLDRLKTVERVSRIADGTRRENTAEHSWHLAMLAMALEPLSSEKVELDRVVKVLLVHDIVEADAGDTYIFDHEAAKKKEALEAEAADRLFGLLPGDEGKEWYELWQEYETGSTPEGRFAKAVDRFQPFLLNAVNNGAPWREKGISAAQIETVMTEVRTGAPLLAELGDKIVAKAVRDGFLESGE